MSFINQIEAWWNNLKVDQSYINLIKDAADMIMNHKADYQSVTDQTNIPFYMVGTIHYREASFNFKTYLANGDPLFSEDGTPIKTIHVPYDFGPFDNWKDAAVGTFKHLGFDKGYHWDLLNSLDNMERYNGLGYRHRNLASPYVWAGTNAYTGGLYQSDGEFNPHVLDQRPGAAPILAELQSRGVDLAYVPLT